jgi:nucleoside-diphosphate-sugar epimerase
LSTVHVADLADFFRRVVEDDSARGYYIIGDGHTPTVAELTEAAARLHGAYAASAATSSSSLRSTPTASASASRCAGSTGWPSGSRCS